jgi:hypothetical protein
VSCTLGDVALCFSGVRRNRLPYTSSRSGIYECGDGEIRGSMVVRTVRSEYALSTPLDSEDVDFSSDVAAKTYPS